jgi:hypothetical protein
LVDLRLETTRLLSRRIFHFEVISFFDLYLKDILPRKKNWRSELEIYENGCIVPSTHRKTSVRGTEHKQFRMGDRGALFGQNAVPEVF